MTEWMPKAGDDVVVKLHSASDDFGYFLDSLGNGFAILLSDLKPVPVAMTVAQAELIEGCIERRHTIRDGALLWSLADLVYAVLAERAPPDPVEAFQAAFEAHRSGRECLYGCKNSPPCENSSKCRKATEYALKAFVAAGGGKS